MSGHGKKRGKKDYIIKPVCYLVVLLVVTVLVALFAFRPVQNIVHLIENQVGMSNRDIVINDDTYKPNTANSADELDFEYGDKVAVISSDAFGLNCSVYYGANRMSMSEGVGFAGDSELFGSNGTSVVRGYTKSFFSPLEYAEAGDIITVATSYGEFDYKISEVSYIDSSREDVIKKHSSKELILCGITSDFSEHSGETLYVFADRINGEVG